MKNIINHGSKSLHQYSISPLALYHLPIFLIKHTLPHRQTITKLANKLLSFPQVKYTFALESTISKLAAIGNPFTHQFLLGGFFLVYDSTIPNLAIATELIPLKPSRIQLNMIKPNHAIPMPLSPLKPWPCLNPYSLQPSYLSYSFLEPIWNFKWLYQQSDWRSQVYFDGFEELI